ncbi:hypothetical protein [Micromonospora sp. KC207]|nr:hypothetical protein [Micromonospora sp. KC207]
MAGGVVKGLCGGGLWQADQLRRRPEGRRYAGCDAVACRDGLRGFR